MDKDLVDRIDETLHDLFQAMNLDRIPIQREYGKYLIPVGPGYTSESPWHV